MLQQIQQIQDYYKFIVSSLDNNRIQEVSHKKVKQYRQKLSSLGFGTHHLDQNQTKRINQMTQKFKIIDQKFEYAISNYILKNQFQDDLRSALNPQKTIKKDQRLIRNQESSYYSVNKTEKQIKNEYEHHSIKSEDLCPNPQNVPTKNQMLPFRKKEYSDLTHDKNKYARQTPYRIDQLARKQQIIQKLIKQNMRLQKTQQNSNYQNIRNQRQKRQQIHQTNNNDQNYKQIVQQNKQIKSKLSHLEDILMNLQLKSSQKELKNSHIQSQKVQDLKLQKQKSANFKEDLFVIPKSTLKNNSFNSPTSEKYVKQHSNTIIGDDFGEYFMERDKLQRTRNTIPQFSMNSNNLKSLLFKTQSSGHNKLQFPKQNKIVNFPYPINTSTNNFQTPPSKLLISNRSPYLASQNSFLTSNKIDSSLFEPDLRQYILPKQKKMSGISLMSEQDQDSDMRMKSSIAESLHPMRQSMNDFNNYNENQNDKLSVSFDTFLSVSSRGSSDKGSYLLGESRQNLKNQNAPKITNISKQNLVRNKVAFFKKSLIIIKNQLVLQIGFKRSQLNRQMDYLRASIYIKNKLDTQEPIDITYQYDRKCYEVIVGSKAEILRSGVDTQQDISVHYKGHIPLSFILVRVQLQDSAYQFVLPVLFFSFKEGLTHTDPTQVKTVTLFPEKPFGSPRFLHSLLPLTYVNQHEQAQYRRGQKSYISECTLKSKTTLQGFRLEWVNGLIRMTCDKNCSDTLAWILADVQS